MNIIHYNKETRSFSVAADNKEFATKVLTPNEVLVYSLRKLLECDSGKLYLSKLPKLGRLLTALRFSLIDQNKWPFIYSVNYQFPEDVLQDAKYCYGNGDTLEETYNHIKLSDYQNINKVYKGNDLMLKTQGVRIEDYGKGSFDVNKLIEYGLPTDLKNVYIDLNPLTEKEKKIKEPKDYYDTNISYHSQNIDKSKIHIRLPYTILL